MWLEPETKDSLEEALFRFLTTVSQGNPRPVRLLVAENSTLRELYAKPHPMLIQALHHCVDELLVNTSLDPKEWSKLECPSWMFGVALALNNCLIEAAADEAYVNFTAALIATLPASRQPSEVFTNHALLRNALNGHSSVSRSSRAGLQALIDRSPLSAVWFIHEHTPLSLESLAVELLPGFRSENVIRSAWKNDDDWLNTISSLLEHQDVARVIRQRWLDLPESRQACRNIGLLLEAMRRRGKLREFSLEFYESYDYFRAGLQDDPWTGEVRFWPIKETIEKLLLVAGDTDVALRINRWGNEYFLKFRPLMEIIIAEEGLPRDYNLLTLQFAQSMGRLLRYTTENAVDFGAITFNADEQ